MKNYNNEMTGKYGHKSTEGERPYFISRETNLKFKQLKTDVC